MASKRELYKLAGELGIANRDALDRSGLEKAIKEAKEKGNPMEEPRPEQTVAAKGKSVDDLAKDTADEDVRKAKAAERELEERSKKAAAEREAAKLSAASRKRTLPTQYIVTVGCNMSSNGSLTWLAKDSIVSAKTHNLKDIERAGGQFKECKGTKLVKDQFDRIRTVPVE